MVQKIKFSLLLLLAFFGFSQIAYSYNWRGCFCSDTLTRIEVPVVQFLDSITMTCDSILMLEDLSDYTIAHCVIENSELTLKYISMDSADFKASIDVDSIDNLEPTFIYNECYSKMMNKMSLIIYYQNDILHFVFYDQEIRESSKSNLKILNSLIKVLESKEPIVLNKGFLVK